MSFREDLINIAEEITGEELLTLTILSIKFKLTETQKESITKIEFFGESDSMSVRVFVSNTAITIFDRVNVNRSEIWSELKDACHKERFNYEYGIYDVTVRRHPAHW